MDKTLAASELVLNPDGSLYHCNLLPEHLADTVLLVGDPGRVPTVSAFFDRVEFKTQKREIATHTGIYRGRRLSVVSTGMGTDNIDIVVSELDAVANIDLRRREVKATHRPLTLIRLGTSGALQPDIPVDSILASSHGLGFDGLMHYYAGGERFTTHPFVDAFVAATDWDTHLPRPYLAEGDAGILAKAQRLGFLTGITATATGFYGPQGRLLRLGLRHSDLNERLSAFRHGDWRITNFEMETSALFGLSSLMGHRAMAINCIIGNRFTQTFSPDYQKAVRNMIGQVLEGVLESGN